MTSEQVRALVAAKYPAAIDSPLAALFGSVAASEAADNTIGFAKLQAKASHATMKRKAYEHACSCIDACDAGGVEYDEETLSFNVECNFPDLTDDECDEAAAAALKAAKA